MRIPGSFRVRGEGVRGVRGESEKTLNREERDGVQMPMLGGSRGKPTEFFGERAACSLSIREGPSFLRSWENSDVLTTGDSEGVNEKVLPKGEKAKRSCWGVESLVKE